MIRQHPGSAVWFVAADELDFLPPAPGVQWFVTRQLAALGPGLPPLARALALLGASFDAAEVEAVTAAAGVSIDPGVGLAQLAAAGVIAHELAHSWSGNLVTNAAWKHFWLNEGFTTYVENRIVEALYGREMALMQQVIEQTELFTDMKDLAPADQWLVPEIGAHRDPDEVYSDVPYAKGAWLLRTLPKEDVLGKLSPRSRDRLRDVVACWFLSFVFLAADTQGDGDGFHARKSRHYSARASSLFDAEVMALDYDSDGSGQFSESETDQPQPRPFIRG